MSSYEIEDDVLDNLQEFSFANSLYLGICEGLASEIAARRTAMENATRNSGKDLRENLLRMKMIPSELFNKFANFFDFLYSLQLKLCR